MLTDQELVITQTKQWITDIVVGCNFCPFAAREVKRDSLYFEVVNGHSIAVLTALSAAFVRMNAQAEIESLFLLLPQKFARFRDYLKLVDAAELCVQKKRYSGVYQIATFHPDYLFAGSTGTDPANYTNRSPFPMLQVLREDSLSLAIERYPDTEKIPQKNIAFCRQKGLAYMQELFVASKTCR